MVNQLKITQLLMVRYRLRLTFLFIIIYVAHKIFDIHDKPFSFDNDLIGFLGFLVVLTGLVLRSWAAGVIVKTKKLTTVGPYAIWRHPLYIGSLFIAIGFCIILDDWFLWVVILMLVMLIYLPKVKQEEDKLSSLYPEEWKKYKEQTGAILPKTINVRDIAIKWSFNRWLRHREYNAWLAVTLVLIIIEVWHYYI